MPERKKRKTSTSRKGKKQINANGHAKSLLLKEVESLSRFPAENPNVVMRISKDGNILYSNNAGSLILNEWKCQVGQCVPDGWRELVADVFKSGAKREVEEEHGDQIFLMTLAPIVDEGYVNVYGQDITERKHTEEALRLSEERFRFALSNSPIVVATLDRDLRYTWVHNPMGGFKPEDILGKKVGLSAAPEITENILRSLDRVLTNGESVRWEAKISGNAGDMFFESHAEPLRNAQGEITGVALLSINITERKQAEDAMKQSEMKFKSLAMNTPDVIVRFDPDLRIQYLNSQVERVTGIPAEQFVGKTNEEMGMPPKLCELWNGMFQKAAISKQLQQGEFDFSSPDGTRTFSLRIVPEFAEDGSLTSFLGISQDITDVKKAEEGLRKARDELEMRVQERTRELKKTGDELQAEIAERKKAYIEVRVRADQQAVVAQLGQLAVGGSDLNDLFNETVRRVAQTLNVEYCKILELLPDEKELLLRAGVGWKEGLVGHATVGTGMDSQAGYTLSSDQPVVVEDLKTEKRFRGPPLLFEHQVVSGMSVIIPRREKPFGVLGAHTTKLRTFTSDDIVFLQAVANVLATAIEHKQGEDTIKAERKRFTDVLEKLPAYLVLLTPDYHVSYANRFFRERFGENSGDKRCYEYLFGRSEPCETCETYKTLKTMSPLEWEWRGPDGRNYYIYDSPFTDIDGSTLIMEVGIDITERKKAERNLHEASLYTRSLIEASLDPLVTINAEGKITDVNKATEEATGYSREQLIGSDFSDYFTNPEEARRGYRQVFAEGFVRDYALAIRHKSGNTADVLYNASVYRNEAGEIQGVFAAARDITERKKAEDAVRKAREELETRVEERTKELRQSTWELQAEVTERKKAEENLLETRNYLENLIGYANAPIIVWNPEYRITRFNHAFERLTGLKAEDVLGKPLEILFPEESKDASLKHIHQATSGAYWETVEIPILRADGAMRTVLWNSANILGKDGATIVATIAQGQDITEPKRMQAKLEEYSQHLEQLVEQKTQELKDAQRLATIGETAGMVGHDIRNPLQSIEGAVYLAREEIKALPDGSPEKKELSEVLEIIRHQTNYIDHIVADLQDFSRTPMPQIRETNFRELITEALSIVEIPENIEVQTLIQEDLRTVRVDPVFIKRVILNLVENAAHAMPNGGKLTIKAFYEDEYLHIDVEDTGTGISEESKPKIFTPLFTTKSKGQGFGLPVCKKLVEAHGGKITFESDAGKGTVFKIKMPQGEQAR